MFFLFIAYNPAFEPVPVQQHAIESTDIPDDTPISDVVIDS